LSFLSDVVIEKIVVVVDDVEEIVVCCCWKERIYLNLEYLVGIVLRKEEEMKLGDEEERRW